MAARLAMGELATDKRIFPGIEERRQDRVGVTRLDN